MRARAGIDVVGLCVAMVGLFAGCQDGGKGSASRGESTAPHPAARSDEDAGQESAAPHVAIASGELAGVMQGATRAFLGIPYAKPPVGDLRWKPPQPVDHWQGTRDASQFGKRCAQLASTTLQNAASEDEDCLYLNVWSAAPSGEQLPVMIWIHGGGNVNGSASEPVPYGSSAYFYSGQHLAEAHGVVVVTFNYRLGVFGFFAHPGLSVEGSKSGNQGLWDQRAVFVWVQNNIAQFGGDPKQVTIFGESAGSLDVCLHVAAAGSDGLFERAISESGGCTTLQTTQAQAEHAKLGLAEQLGCQGDDALDCLRGKSVGDLLDAMPSGSNAMGEGFGPIVGDELLPDQPRALYDEGKIAAVPYLLGSNTDEGTLFTSTMVSNQDELTTALQNTFGAAADQVTALYSVDQFKDAQPNPYQAILARAVGDAYLVCSTFDAAQRASQAAPAVYLYNFDIPVDASVTGTFFGATHGSELTYVFGSAPTPTDAQHAASERIERYWTNFAKSGDPNGSDDPRWPRFSRSENVRLNLALDEASTVNNFRAKECAFWQMRYEKQYAGLP